MLSEIDQWSDTHVSTALADVVGDPFDRLECPTEDGDGRVMSGECASERCAETGTCAYDYYQAGHDSKCTLDGQACV